MMSGKSHLAGTEAGPTKNNCFVNGLLIYACLKTMVIKKMAKSLKIIVSVKKRAFQDPGRAINQGCSGGSDLYYVIFLPYGKAGGLQILCFRGFAKD